LIAETGCKVFNFGLSGSTSESIALRNGAYHRSYASENGVLSPGEKNKLTPNIPGPLRLWGTLLRIGSFTLRTGREGRRS
jgi:hypothetical protein